MRRTLALKPLRNAPALSFEWDDETGAISGRDATLVGEIVASAERFRFVAIEPHPSSHRLSAAPLRSAADLAAILGQWYELPDWLEAVRPVGEETTNDDDAAPVDY
jgi:hypothetical protein